MEEQDRSLWDHSEIVEGLELVERALRLHRVGSYQLQAAIAAVHAQAKTAAETDWLEISALYDALAKVSPSPVLALNRAVAVGMSGELEQGLALIDQLDQPENWMNIISSTPRAPTYFAVSTVQKRQKKRTVRRLN